jgi:hypothetical protein
MLTEARLSRNRLEIFLKFGTCLLVWNFKYLHVPRAAIGIYNKQQQCYYSTTIWNTNQYLLSVYHACTKYFYNLFNSYGQAMT